MSRSSLALVQSWQLCDDKNFAKDVVDYKADARGICCTGGSQFGELSVVDEARGESAMAGQSG